MGVVLKGTTSDIFGVKMCCDSSFNLLDILFLWMPCILKIMFLFFHKKYQIFFKENQNGRTNGNKSKRELLDIHSYSATTQTSEEQTQNRLPKQVSYSAFFNVLALFYQLQSLQQGRIDDKNQWLFTSLVSNFFSRDILLRRVDKCCSVKYKNANSTYKRLMISII